MSVFSEQMEKLLNDDRLSQADADIIKQLWANDNHWYGIIRSDDEVMIHTLRLALKKIKETQHAS